MEILHKYDQLTPFVKSVILMEDNDPNAILDLPIYADGFPGVMYSETVSGIYLEPKHKLLSQFFLYGQTIKPIKLTSKGPYKSIVFQLYPFAARLLLGVNPKELNDDCYDLLKLGTIDTKKTTTQLNRVKNLDLQVEIITAYLNELVKISASNEDHRIKLAVNTILKHHGHISIKQLRDQLHIGERTFERHFANEIGVTPKQFAKIIQFNFSLNQLKDDHYVSLTEISYERGFSDQSHFIKTFKRYTGKTPKEFQGQLSV